MPNYAPYVIILIDLILLSTVAQQLRFRYRIYYDYAHIDVIREQVVHKRKDIYRIVISFLLFTKTCHTLCWLLYQGFGALNLKSYIKLWLFWIFYGVTLCISFLLKGDFASVVVGIEQNICENGKKKALWRGLLMGSAVLSSILVMWGVALSVYITYVPIWQYIGFATSILNGFITYKMLKSIVATTRETQASTYQVQPSITAKEFEKQLFTLFHMKQMVVALLFIGLYAVYAFCINLYYIVLKSIIAQPFLGNDAWYLYSKLIIYNLYVYSMTLVVLIYTWISSTAIREAAIKADRKLTDNDIDNGENDIVIMPDTLEIVYPPNIDPNDPDNLYNGGNVTDTEDINYPRQSRRNSVPKCIDINGVSQTNKASLPNSSPLSHSGMTNMAYANANAISNHNNPSSPSKLSVMSHTMTTLNIENGNGNGNDINTVNEDGSVTTTMDMFGHILEMRHMGQSSIATDINIDGFIAESHKERPYTTMFDMDIIQMAKRGCSLERIYFDSQKFRGITPKSLRITAKMRSVSYSTRNVLRRSRRGSQHSGIGDTNSLIPSRSVPNVLKNGSEMKDDMSELSAQSTQILYQTSLQHKYSIDSTQSNVSNASIKPNIQNISAYGNNNGINITVPEDAVLTPDKGNNGTMINVEPHISTVSVSVDVIKENEETINDAPPHMALSTEKVYSNSLISEEL